MQRAHGIGNNDSRAGQSPLPLEHYVDTWATTRSLEVLKKHVKETPEKVKACQALKEVPVSEQKLEHIRQPGKRSTMMNERASMREGL